MCEDYKSARKLKQKSHDLYSKRVERVSLGLEPSKPLSPNSMFPSVVNNSEKSDFEINIL